jgi:glycosyltransferase involved in cell wall biosynthesis
VQVFFDSTVFLQPHAGGIVRYFAEVSRRLPAAAKSLGIPLPQVEVHAGWHHLPNASQLFHETVFHGTWVPRWRGSWRLARAWNEWRLARVATSLPGDDLILHETYYGSRAPRRPHVKRVVTIHDMIPEETAPDASRWLVQAKQASVAAADGIIFVSESTRSRFMRIHECKKPFRVIPHAGTLRIMRERRLPDVPWPFILHVGARKNYKNWVRLVYALANNDQARNYGLVCTGPDFDDEDLGTLSRNGFPLHRVRHIRGDDDILADLYEHAACFVFPSLAEGFGIPLLEAASLRCPIACSEIDAFREVIGDHAHYFDPTDPESMASAINAAMSAGRTSQMILHAHARAAEFSWERAAESTLSFYRELL